MGKDHYDVLVIGSGPGGATTAARVAETGKRVLLLERGDFLPRERDNWNSRAVFGMGKYTASETFYDLHDRPFQPELHYCVGGNSKVYGAALLRLPPADFGEVRHSDGVAPAWPLTYQDMEPYYVRAERLFWVHGQHGEDPFAGISSQEYEYPAVRHEPHIQQVSDGLEGLGLHPFHLPLGVQLAQDADGLPTRDSLCIRCDRIDGFPCPVGAKADAESAVLRPALAAHPNLVLMTRTTVERLLTDSGGSSVTGAAVTLPDGSPHTFTADIVVVSAGAILSAALLLKSANDRHPNGLANSSDQVGRNYVRHNNLALIAFSREANLTVFQKTLALNDFYGPSEYWQYPMGHIQMLGKSDDWQVKGAAPRGLGWAPSAPYGQVARHSVDFWLSTEDIPLADSRVTLRPDGAIRLALQPDNNVEALRRLRQTFQGMLSKIGMVHMRSVRSLYLHKGFDAAATAHQAGTARFGTDPATSVLDVNCRAHDLDNLYVVDGSFMPSVGAVNPTLTIIANALRVGDHIAERTGTTDHPQPAAACTDFGTTAQPVRGLLMAKIEDYALLGDLHTAALVSTAGSVDWLCLPRFDSPAAFAALLHDDQAGHWTLAPAAASNRTTRRYARNTLVLETDWQSEGGTVRVIDFMPPRARTPHLIRIAVGLSGEVAMRSTLRLRFDYGRVVPWVKADGTQIHAIAGPDLVRLLSPVPLRGDHWETLADFAVRKGNRIAFVMSWAPSHDPAMEHVDAEQALSATADFWTQWSAGATYQAGPYNAAVDRSLITLKALTYEPTGGIVAAATTSLPEELGGVRNWDYRYCWLRDATYTLQALLAAGFRSEAGAWRDWLLRSIAGQPEALQILYSIDGTRRLPENELSWLTGYEHSSPVRTGNAASEQLQLDVWGETLDALFLARQAGLPADRDAWALQVALMNHLESAWRDPDNGLWEVRGDQQHFTHSKVLAWAAADRMARSVRMYDLPGPAQRWEQLRDQVHHDVITHAFDAERNTFTQAYGSPALDASLLLIPRVGFLPATDPRVLGTIDAIRRELTEDGLVKRYQTSQTNDGLKGSEGLFIACSFWLADALHASGRQQDAIDLFERLLSLRNDVGLLSEEWDPAAQRQLGNTPQAFSHFALVVSGLQLHMQGPARSDNPMAR